MSVTFKLKATEGSFPAGSSLQFVYSDNVSPTLRTKSFNLSKGGKSATMEFKLPSTNDPNDPPLLIIQHAAFVTPNTMMDIMESSVGGPWVSPINSQGSTAIIPANPKPVSLYYGYGHVALEPPTKLIKRAGAFDNVEHNTPVPAAPTTTPSQPQCPKCETCESKTNKTSDIIAGIGTGFGVVVFGFVVGAVIRSTRQALTAPTAQATQAAE